MLADHVESEVLCLLDVEFESFISGCGIKSVRPPALVKGSKLEQALAVKPHELGVAILPVCSDLTHGCIRSDLVYDLAIPENLDIKAIEIRRIRRPEFWIPDIERHRPAWDRHPGCEYSIQSVSGGLRGVSGLSGISNTSVEEENLDYITFLNTFGVNSDIDGFLLYA